MTKRKNALAEQKVYRQGDVWIYPISPADYRVHSRTAGATVTPDPEKGLILAEGEVTGHHHRIPVPAPTKTRARPKVQLRVSRANGEVRILDVRDKPVDLVHEEHETIKLPPGQYEVRIQREYAPTARSREVRVYD
jgi:hypothetical protein